MPGRSGKRPGEPRPQRARQARGDGPEQHRGCDRCDSHHRPNSWFLVWIADGCREQMVVVDRGGLVCGWRRPTCYSTGRPRKAETMTDVQLYLLIVPLVLLDLGGVDYWWATNIE